MGNCQAIDNATLAIQHPSGKVEHRYSPITAGEIMKMNPGHYVALLLTTTLYPSTATKNTNGEIKKAPLRVTRIKLLRETDTLVLGHVYRIVTNQEVMKGLWAKKQAKLKQQQQSKQSSDIEVLDRKSDLEKTKQVKHAKHRSRNNTHVNAASSKSKAWQPALNSISEADS